MQLLVHQRQPAADIQPARLWHGSLWSFDWNRLKEDPPEIIYHFARIPGRGSYGRKLAAFLSNIANRRLIRWLQQQSQPPLLVLIAGTLAYGNHGDREITEDEPLCPISFAREYHFGERPILEAKHIPRQIMRPAWVYGHGSWFKSFYLRPMLEHGYVPLYGDGNNWMSLVHVEDVAGLIEFLSNNGPSGETFNLFGGSALKQRQLTEILHQISGLPICKMDLKLLRRMDKAVAEAFTFSLRVGTKHRALYEKYRFLYPDLNEGMKNILKHMGLQILC